MPTPKILKFVKKIQLESGDIVLISKDTVGHLAGWIDSLYRASKNLPDCGILSALILDTNKKIHWHGGFIAPNDFCPLSYGMTEKYHGQFPGTRQVDVVPFICAIIKKKLVKELEIPENIGEDIFIDADYCLKAMASGFRVYATDKLAVIYQGGPKNERAVMDYARKFAEKAAMFKQKWSSILSSHYTHSVLMQAKFATPSGFSMVARNYARALTQSGIKVFIESLDTVLDATPPTNDEIVNALMSARGDTFMPQIIWGQAPWFIKNSGVYKIGHCETEGTDVPKSWVHYCNMMDEIWVPTKWDREKFVKAGVNCPIYLVPQGIDPNYFHPEMAPMQTDAKESVKFLCNAAWFPRKNLRNLIVSFQNEFKRGEDVCLILKTINLGLNTGIKEEIAKIPDKKESANVYVKEEMIPDAELGCLYTMADALIMPTRGEAWGLPLFEALACGIPVVTTDYGAPSEILKDKKGKPLPGVHFIKHRLVRANTPYVYLQRTNWAEPSLLDLQKKMRYLFENISKEKKEALKTSKYIRENYNWGACVKPIIERLKDIYSKNLKNE